MRRIAPHLLILPFVCLLLLSIIGYDLLQASSQDQSGGKIVLTLWYRNRSLDDHLLARIEKQFPSIHVQALKIGGNFDAKLRTAMAGHSNVPDLVTINANIATYFPDEDQLVDLRTLGSDQIAHDYLGWKWQMATTPTGRLLALPVDTGPTALFYRADLFRRVGLPTDPQALAAQLPDWDAYIQAGQRLQRTLPGIFMFDDITTIFTQIMSQSEKQFFDATNRYIGDQDHVRRAWNYAVKAYQSGLVAKATAGTGEWNADANNGTLASFVGASWMKQRLLQASPSTAGQWRIAPAPGGAGNNGGSFLALTRYGTHPDEAFAVMCWLLSPQNQAQSYVDNNLFPSTPGAFADARLSRPEPFFGGQITTPVFSQAARQTRSSYFGPASDIVNRVFQRELSLVETQDKNPTNAWNDAQREIQRELSH